MKKKKIVAWVIAASIFQSFAERRVKRIIDGEILTYKVEPAYAVILYFAWIGFTQYDLIEPQKMDAADELCGGALMTTYVVQSACHCFAGLKKKNDEGVEWYERNEHTMNVVVGKSWTDPESKLMTIRRYVIHPFCRKVYGKVSHDFALVVLNAEVKLPGGRFPRIVLAPVYPLADMIEMWKRFHTKQVVCLMVGFGQFIPNDEGTKSTYLRHAWLTLQSYRFCFFRTRNKSINETVDIVTYKTYATWSCLKHFRNMKGGVGDSGSPITCDDKYFGVHTQAGVIFNNLIFYAYANCHEYRDKMTADVHNPNSSPFLDITHQPDTLFHPDPAPRN